MKLLREWKKVFESDLDSIIMEMKDSIEVPAIIILTGDLGLGKTTFTKAFVSSESDGEGPEVNSPTYSIINDSNGIVHADFYRLKSPEEIIHLELPLYVEDKEYFLIEWGKAYLNEIQKQVHEDFFYYEIIISANEGKLDSRNYSLYKLTDI